VDLLPIFLPPTGRTAGAGFGSGFANGGKPIVPFRSGGKGRCRRPSAAGASPPAFASGITAGARWTDAVFGTLSRGYRDEVQVRHAWIRHVAR
jgi:hypothetical protein